MSDLPPTIVILGRLPGLNELISGRGRPWWRCRKVKDEAMQVVQWHFHEAKINPYVVPIILAVKWIERDGRRDRDNVTSGGAKILLDAMKKQGIIVDDSRKWVFDIQHDTSMIDKNNPRVEITIIRV